MSATPEVRRRAAEEGTENEAFESEDDDSAPSEGEEGEDEDEVQELPRGHPAVEITPSLEKATEEAMQTLNDALRRESLMMASPEEEKPDPFVVAAVIHANGESRCAPATECSLLHIAYHKRFLRPLVRRRERPRNCRST